MATGKKKHTPPPASNSIVDEKMIKGALNLVRWSSFRTFSILSTKNLDYCDDSVTTIQTILKSSDYHNTPISENIVSDVLRRYKHEWKSSLCFFNWASSQTVYGSQAYNKMLDILGRMKQIELMLQLFDEMPKQKVDRRTFEILMNRCAGAHQITKLNEIFYRRGDYGFPIDTEAFRQHLMYLCRYKHVEDAETLFLQKQTEFPADIKTWNIILNGWCVLGNYRESKRVWKDILCSGCRPDLFTYGTFINALTKAGKLNPALDLFDKMSKKGHHPDVVIHNCMIDALCFKKRIPEALRLFAEMIHHGPLPNVATYNSLIKHLCKIGRMEKAYELLGDMELQKCFPNERTYTYFLKQAKSPDEVDCLRKRMGVIDSNDTYNLILNLYVRWNHQTGIQSIWSEMKPDRRSYIIMIHGFHSKGNLEGACKYFCEMKAKGMLPEPRTLVLMKQVEFEQARLEDDIKNN